MDWLVFTIKALQPRGETTTKERLIARTNNIEVQGLRAEVEQLKRELRQRPQNQYPSVSIPISPSISIPPSVSVSSVSTTVLSKQFSSKNYPQRFN